MKIKKVRLGELMIGLSTGMVTGMIAGMLIGPPIMRKIEKWDRKRKDLKILREIARQKEIDT